MARQATVQWNEAKQRWMAWVRFPDGSRRKIERVESLTPRPISRICSLSGRRPLLGFLGESGWRRSTKERKSFTVEQLEGLLLVAIPADSRPPLWITGLMCGLRPGELAGLRWAHVDIDCDEPHIVVAERAKEVKKHYVGQAEPKTSRKRCDRPSSTLRACGRVLAGQATARVRPGVPDRAESSARRQRLVEEDQPRPMLG